MTITFHRKFVLPQKYFQPDVKGEFFRHNCALFTDKFLCYLDNIFSLMWRGFFQMQGKWTMVSLFTDNFLWYLDNIFSLIWRGLLSEARQGHQGEALVSLPCFWQKSPLYQTTTNVYARLLNPCRESFFLSLFEPKSEWHPWIIIIHDVKKKSFQRDKMSFLVGQRTWRAGFPQLPQQARLQRAKDGKFFFLLLGFTFIHSFKGTACNDFSRLRWPSPL